MSGLVSGRPPPHIRHVNADRFGPLSQLQLAIEHRACAPLPPDDWPARHPARRQPSIHQVPSMANGTIKWFNATKGYGFIQPEDGSKDVFVHITDVQRAGIRELREGDKISYDLQSGNQGKVSATNLRLD
jgi:CspA family cold shock protein